MNVSKKDLLTMQQIDGTSIKTPHDRELQTVAKAVLAFLPGVDHGTVVKTAGLLGARVHDLEFGEAFTLSFEYFPGVRIHALYFQADDDDGVEAEVKFFFSGDVVSWVSTEDLASLADLTMDYFREVATGVPGWIERHDGPSDLLQRSIMQRVEPFGFIKRIDLPALAAFLGGTLGAVDGEWHVTKTFFPGVDVRMHFDGKMLRFTFTGEKAGDLNSHARDQLAIFTMNHALRWIRITYSALDMPDMVDKAFSFSYIRRQL